jgi:nucleotide-binding universal stress UspA family protein
MMGIEQPFIVVGVDGSAQSIKALEWGVRHAKLLGAKVHAIGAWEVPISVFITFTYVEDDYGRDATEVFDRAIAVAVEALGDDGAGVVIETQLVQKQPRKALHDAAIGAMCLVVGSHGHGGSFPGVHLGSIASYCVHHAPCPVVVIRDIHG